VALALTASVLLLDALLPGVSGARAGLIGRLAALMYGVCPQRPSHSYTLGGVQLPLEARLTGIFGGIIVGVGELATIGRSRLLHWPRPPVILATLFGFGVMALDGFNAVFYDLGWPHAYAPDLRLRLATGILAGVALAFALVPALVQATPPTSADGAVPGWRDLGWTLLGGGGFAALVTSGWGPLLSPVALLSSGGVVLTLLLANWIALRDIGHWVSGGPAAACAAWWLGVPAAGMAVAELALAAALRSTLLPG